MFNLRYYQEEILASVRAAWDKVQSTAVVAATGVGKTEVYMALAVTEPGRALVLVHRDYLITQPIRRLAAVGFTDVAIEKAESRSEGGLIANKVVFASVQSLSKPRRLETFDPFKFSILIVDEGHRAVAATYRRVIDHFRRNPRLRVLILTATPKRKDGVALGNVCESVAYVYGPKRASDEGWIVPLRFFRREVEGLDFSRVNLKGSDLDQEQVEALLIQEEPLHKVCASLAEDRGSTIIFCPGVSLARAYATLMNQRYRPDRAAVLWQDSDSETREVTAKKLANGDLDYVFNCDLFTEGADVPELARVVWAAPTASLVRFTQGTGRVFRPHGSLRGHLLGGKDEATQRRLLIEQSPKPFGQVVTYYPQNCKHQLCEPNDILEGDELPPDVRTATKAVQEITALLPGGSDPEKDVETARAFLELRTLLDRRRKRIKAKAAVSDVEYDGFGGSRYRNSGNGTGAERASLQAISDDWPAGDAATEKQIRWFLWKGVGHASSLGLTKWRAHIIRNLVDLGVSMATALSYGKKQALAVEQSMRARKEGQVE